MIDPIKPRDFDYAVSLLRDFFKSKGFIEAGVQHRLSILAACEDPATIGSFDYMGSVWPLPQTGQMHLEVELLKDPSLEKIFTVTTSYRQEPNIIDGRHSLIFPMFEFESIGNMTDLLNLEIELCQHLGFKTGLTSVPFIGDQKYPQVQYTQVSEKYNSPILTADHETQLQQDYGDCVFLTHFPEHTSPFWNMKRSDNLANKVDVIMHGIETIGSAERETSVDTMRHRFYSTSNGEYAKLLYAHFGRERVEAELEDFLSLNFFPRYGGGIGITRLIRALKLNNMLSI